MEGTQSTLVVLLSMHRCGSSLTANILQRLGMSLGPFELNGALPSNPYGHFESIPFMLLNREVQYLAHGFRDDLPDSAETLKRFVAKRGAWDDSVTIPEKMIAEGRSILRALLYSGRIAGFKDPRTVLAWPFWEKVLEGFPGLRVVMVGLVRSPHEIAMSLTTRRGGLIGYFPALDVVGAHLNQMKQILDSRSDRPEVVCFGDPSYLPALKRCVEQCGLTWDEDVINEVIDQGCIHHVPAAIAHEAQSIFDSMLAEPREIDASKNMAQLARDSRAIEEFRLGEIDVQRQRIAELEQVESRGREVERHLHTVVARLAESQRMHDQTTEALNAMQAKLIASQEREIRAWEHNEQLRDRLERYESHPIIGLALRSRRRLKGLVHSVRKALANGHPAHELSPGSIARP
jgi:hypothetical protein